MLTCSAARQRIDMTTSLMPVLTGHTETADGAKTRIDLNFSTAMQAGPGKIYVTDGAMQTVIDPATGQPVTRVAGATHTIEISASSLHYSGTHVYTDALDLQPGHQYSILFQPGALSSVGGPVFSGWIRPGQTLFTTATTAPADTTPPVALAAPVLDVDSDKGLSDSDGITNDNTPTFGGAGAEAFATIRLFSGSTQVGQATAGADGKWTITSNPLTTEGLHWITAKQIDQAGNESPASPAFKLTLDGSAPALRPYNSTVAHEGTFELKFTDLIYIPGSVGEVAVYRNDTLFSTIKPGDPQWVVETDGIYEYSVLKLVGLVDGAYRLHTEFSSPVNMTGIASTGLLQNDITFTVGGTAPPASLAAPLLDPTSDSGVAGDAITNTAVIHGSGAQGGSTITVYNVSGSDVLGTTVADAGGNWSFTMDGEHFQGSYSVTVTQKDSGGNESAKSAALSLAIDSHAGAPAQPLLNLADATTVDGLVHTLVDTPSLSGSGCEAGATVELFDGDARLGSTTANSDGTWSITTGHLSTGLHHFAAQQTDIAGNVSAYSSYTDLSIDAPPPPSQLAAPVLAAASDSGASSSDRITNITTPTFTGSGALANATIELYEGTTKLGHGTSNADGTWSVAVDSANSLLDGEHAITVKQVNAGGTASAQSDAVNVTIDTIAPGVGGFTSTVPLGSRFEIWFSEPVDHSGLTNYASMFNGTSLFSLPLSSSWTDNVMKDGHLSSVWGFQPSTSGWVELELTGVKDAAGNVATIPLAHHEFSVPVIGINVLSNPVI